MTKQLRVTVNGKAYDVTVELPDDMVLASSPTPPTSGQPAAISPVPVAVSAPYPAPAASTAAAGPGDVVSPLSAKVVSIETSVGASVKEGEQLLTLEAMKMNTFVFSPKDGTIKAILVEAGAGVNEGDVLITIA